MEFSRRRFLQFGAAAGAAMAATGKKAHAMELTPGGKSVTKKGVERKAVPYTCMTCNIEDGGIAYVEDGRIVKLEGNPKQPGNRGRLCAKGNAGWQHVYDPERILFPLKRAGKRGEGKWKRVSWDEALNEVAGKIRDHIKSGKERDEICFKWGRNRTHGFIDRWMNALGSSATMNHTSVCESSKKIGMQATWGPDIETPDFANTKYIINFGSNILEAAYFHNPYAQRIMDGVVGNKAKMVTFDVRLSNTAAKSDEWHPVFPGTDGVIALAMANVIMQEGLYDAEFINDWVNVSAGELKSYLAKYTPQMAEGYSGVKAADIARIAREFAMAKPATTYTYRGPCKHMYGSYNERSCMLLPIITGNVERKGGYCLPRGMGWDGVEPNPPKPKGHSLLHQPHDYPLAGHHVSHHVPFLIMEGKAKVSIWMDYYDNPAYSFPSSHVWRKIYQDEKMIPYFVTFSPVISETSQYADIILPDVSYLERHDPENMPSDLLPWIGIRQPVVKPLGESREFRDVILDLANRIDPDGSLEIKKYFSYGTTEDYMHKHFDNVKGLKEVGGYEYLKKNGVFPDYGKLDPADYRYYKDGKLVEPEYGLHMKEDPKGVEVKGKKRAGFGTPSKKIEIKSDLYAKAGFNPMPVFKEHPWHWEKGKKKLKSGQMILTTFKWNVHTQARTSNLPLLSEIVHKNPAWINSKTAAKLGIKNNDLVRITSGVGHMVTRANVTESIHPEVVAVSTAVGHKVGGRFATANKDAKAHQWAGDDAELKHMWWDDAGVHPNDIIPVSTDPIGGSQGWFDTVVTVEKAHKGDKYGDVVADLKKAVDFYKETLTYNVAGPNHKKVHPELASNTGTEKSRVAMSKGRKDYNDFDPVIV
ncbi:MAG: molybdopterin-dependent oxidoreductase [Nitrospinae bacterium]|nr:molybdopterin-dependent oxidoreductase [Nitrospinota bacterium]